MFLYSLPCRQVKRQCVFAGILTAPTVPAPKDGKKKKAKKPLKEIEEHLLREVKDYFRTYVSKLSVLPRCSLLLGLGEGSITAPPAIRSLCLLGIRPRERLLSSVRQLDALVLSAFISFVPSSICCCNS